MFKEGEDPGIFFWSRLLPNPAAFELGVRIEYQASSGERRFEKADIKILRQNFKVILIDFIFTWLALHERVIGWPSLTGFGLSDLVLMRWPTLDCLSNPDAVHTLSQNRRIKVDNSFIPEDCGG